MLSDADVKVLLTQERLAGQWATATEQVVSLDQQWKEIGEESREKPRSGVTAENLAYVIYTSGSTGRPKGVMIPHRGLCNHMFWIQSAHHLTSSDAVVQKTPFSFDVSIWEFFWPLMVGARLVVARPMSQHDSEYMIDLIKKHQITTIYFVASALQLFLDTPGVNSCVSLKHVFCGGEALPLSTQDFFFERSNAQLHNIYGPTEAAIDITCWTCERGGKRRQQVPLGHPIANTQIYILDSKMQPVPIGVAGELYIGGANLGRGYLKQPEMTAEKFVPNPFSTVAGTRLYRTGDLARYNDDSTIEFLGRLDHQVKVRGFRIELGEIETVLNQHPAVRESVVVVREDTPGDKRLVAYLVMRAGETQMNVSELRSYVRERLPEHMVPGVFVVLERLPLTPNGKLDRKALPVPEGERPELSEAYQGPRSRVEEVIARIWQEVLGLERVGVFDNFFELGGHSLLATQIISRLRDALHVEVPLLRIFESPTVSGLATTVSEKIYGPNVQVSA